MKRLLGSLIVLGLLGGAVWVGLASGATGDVFDDNDPRELDCSESDKSSIALDTSLEIALEGEAQEVIRNSISGIDERTVVLRTLFSPPREIYTIIDQGRTVALVELRRAATDAWYIIGLTQCDVAGLDPQSAAKHWPDPDDRELDCPPGDLIQSTTADYPFGAKGFQGEAEDAVKRSLEGLQPGDEVRPNFRDFGAWAQVIRDRSLIGIVELGWTGSGWLVTASSVCASSRLLHG